MKKGVYYLMALAMMTSTMATATSVWAETSNSQNYDFEEGLEGWEARGSAKVEVTKDQAKSGNSSVYVSGRTANWNGISKEMVTLMEKEKSYTVGAWVKYEEGADTEALSVTLQVAPKDKDATYSQIAHNAAVKKGEWTYLEGKVTIPNDTASAVIYLEAANPELNFYVDHLTITGEAGQTTSASAVKGIQQDLPSLKEVYQDDFKIGTAISTRNIQDIDKQAILKHFNSLTCGNEMKPESVLDYDATIAYTEKESGDQTHPQISFKAADSLLKFAGENHIPMRGHVFAWHSQTPNWFFKENYSKDPSAPNASREVMLQRLENYMKCVFETLEKEYPDVEFYAWDVVNEAINPSTETGFRLAAESAETTGDDGNDENAGKSMWVTTIGDDFIEKAFEYARKYAPEGVKLTYNDYNECDPVKSELIYNLCKKLVAEGNLDVIGMQGHYNMDSPSVSQLEAAIRKYASLGVEIEVTELDVMQTDSSEEGMLKQGYRYKEIMDTLRALNKEPNINIGACVLWGIDDGTSWRSEKKPLLFDENYKAKPAYWALVDSSKLAPVKQEIKANKMGTSQEETWKTENATLLKISDGTSVAQLKVSWDEKNVYVKVEPLSAAQKAEGTVEIWIDPNQDGGQSIKADDIAKQYTLKEGETFTIPITGGLKEGQSFGMDVRVSLGNQVATWNDSKYTGDVIPDHFGKVTLRKADGFVEAGKGTPVIDGKQDEIWNNARTIDVNCFTVGESGATATAKALWDENYIYVLVDVKDTLLSKKSANAHEQDSVEVFIDEDHGKTKTYEKGDVQYRVNFDNEHSINGETDPNGFKSATQLTKEGYQVEFALPYHVTSFTAGQLLGFEVQVNNDENGNGVRDSVANWSDETGNGWSSTENYGTLELK